jgi:adenylate kinase
MKMAKAKKSASKKAASKKSKATPAQLAALAKGRAKRAANKAAAEKAAQKAAPKKAAKKSAKKAAPMAEEKAAPKKAAKKAAPKKAAKKAAPKKAAKKAAPRKQRAPRPSFQVPPHGGSAKCTKCGRLHSLREHWSHSLLHGTSEMRHSYLCKRGGFCEFALVTKRGAKSPFTKLSKEISSGTAQLAKAFEKGKGKLTGKSLQKQMEIAKFAEKLRKLAQRSR